MDINISLTNIISLKKYNLTKNEMFLQYVLIFSFMCIVKGEQSCQSIFHGVNNA